MAFKKILLPIAACLCLATMALAEGAPDIYFKTKNLRDHDGTTCRTGISPFRGNLALMDKMITGPQAGDARIRTFDRVHGKKNTFFVPSPSSSIAFEVSDSGPGNFINVAYLLNTGFSSARPMFSQDSGATFQQLTLTPHSSFTVYMSGSFGRSGADGGKNIMKFDANGRLHIYWFTRHNTFSNRFILNHQVFNQDGTSYLYEVIGPQPPAYITYTTSTLSGARIHVVTTDTKVVALTQNPSIGWWCSGCSGGQTKYDVPVAIVHDIVAESATQVIGIGATSYSLNGSYYNYLGAMSASPITSDGVNVYFANQTPRITTAFGTTNNFQIRRFPKSGDGMGYFPDNRPNTSDGAFTDLENMGTNDPRVETSSFWTKTQSTVQDGNIYGFVAPRWRRNRPGWVDLIYRTPDQMFNGGSDYVQRTRFNPEVPLSLQQALSKPVILNDTRVTTYQPNGRASALGVSLATNSFDAIPVEGASAVSWCQNQSIGESTGATNYTIQVMDIN